ncbi:hypothetical protein C9I98_01155 [Photobacterium sanctipauli]|uniref:Uncharacterized protein n=1 Tax=Photobacterium sanctipauli TaxID=1342794 RepID=A0A2T3P053_9GAMM|nr:hypothetical protein [Photobacterium sanctipauli]PSW21904.1 hypothetical protein C9I98_01155 [Photobacterium sanctipauli]
MKKLTQLLVVSAISCSAVIAQASISFMTVDDTKLTSLSDDEMSTLRGGFVTINDESIINIGLSINTAIDGQPILSTHIADLTINNGVLTGKDGTTYEDINPLNLVQVSSNSVVTKPLSGDAVGVVIQNDVNGKIINTETILDIEADVDSFNHQTLFRSRLENSILYNGY